MADTAVFWSVICNPGGAAANAVVMNGDFSTATTLAGAALNPANTFAPGNVFMVTLTVGDAGASAAACNVVLNEEHTMLISVQGGGTTYEALTYSDTTQGASVV